VVNQHGCVVENIRWVPGGKAALAAGSEGVHRVQILKPCTRCRVFPNVEPGSILAQRVCTRCTPSLFPVVPSKGQGNVDRWSILGTGEIVSPVTEVHAGGPPCALPWFAGRNHGGPYGSPCRGGTRFHPSHCPTAGTMVGKLRVLQAGAPTKFPVEPKWTLEGGLRSH